VQHQPAAGDGEFSSVMSGHTASKDFARPDVSIKRKARSTFPGARQRAMRAWMGVAIRVHTSSVVRKIISAARIGSTSNAARIALPLAERWCSTFRRTADRIDPA
jgi:hypothetical protein